MKRYDSLDRTASLKRLIPGLFDMTCLYIGARDDRFDYGKHFTMKPDIVEVWLPNCLVLERNYTVFNVDIRKFETRDNMYEVVFWWHGPEHIHKRELKETIKRLENIATKAIVIGCPWGRFNQGPIQGNPYEVHIAHYSHQVFERLGYKVECLGTKNKRGSNITAVKWI